MASMPSTGSALPQSQEIGLAGLPVVFLSAIGALTGEDYDPDMIDRLYGVRPDAFLPKPIEPKAVAEQLRAFIGA